MKIDDIRNFPNRLTVEITNSCNLKCIMCPRQIVDEVEGMMDINIYKKIIHEAKEHLPVTFVPFFRGESLLHPRFIEMIKMAKDAGIGPIQLTTNAMLLDEETSNELIDAGLDFISFSLDVLGKETYEAARAGGDYEKVLNNIERFLEIKKEKLSKLPETQVSAVETGMNKDVMQDFVYFWNNKVERVRIYPEHSSNGAFGSLKEKGNLPDFDKRLPCKKVFTDLVIYWDGDVALCNHDWDRKETIGNVGDASIQTLWNGSKYKEIRKRHMDGGIENDPTCGGCDHWMTHYLPEGIIGRLYKGKKA